MLLRSLLPFVLAALPLLAQGASPPAEPAATTKKLHLRVIGASVSGGFEDGPAFGAKEQGDSVTLQHVLTAWCGEHARVSTHATPEMTGMFLKPLEIGPAQVQGVAKAKADLVVAIDFPFWFAYGYVFDGDEAKARQELLAKGCELLAQLEVPVLIGDLPDMTGAAPRMLGKKQIPTPAVLAELNEQLAGFVRTHAKVRQVSLSQLVQTMKEKGATLPLAGGPLVTAPGALLQEDRLHATRLGMAYLGHVLQDAVRPMFPEGHALRSQVWTFEQFVEACAAEPELETLQKAAKEPAKEPAGAGKGG